jgi:predicted Zn-dependent protease
MSPEPPGPERGNRSARPDTGERRGERGNPAGQERRGERSGGRRDGNRSGHRPGRDAAKEGGAAPAATQASRPNERAAIARPAASVDVGQIFDRLEAALAMSPADETEFVWIESRRGEVATKSASRERFAPRPVVEVLVRVHERGRVGTHRTGAADTQELLNGVRQALAQARVHEALPGLPHLPADPHAVIASDLTDEAIARFDRDAWSHLESRLPAGHQMTARWTSGNVVVANSRAVRRAVSPTAIEVEIARQGGEGSRARAAHAAVARRHLHELDFATLATRLERAAAGGGSGTATAPEGETAILLGPEASARLFEELVPAAFSAHAYRDGSSLLREHLGVQIFDPSLAIADDGQDARGLPFPFDLEGTVKHRVDLIRGGAPRTPALDQRHSALLGLAVTPLASGGDDALAENVFVQPGQDSTAELARKVDHGVWIGRLEAVRISDIKKLTLRAVARNVRLIEHGVVGAALPDQIWETRLIRAFSRLTGVGSETTVLAPARHGGLFGGTFAPAIALAQGGRLSPAD